MLAQRKCSKLCCLNVGDEGEISSRYSDFWDILDLQLLMTDEGSCTERGTYLCSCHMVLKKLPGLCSFMQTHCKHRDHAVPVNLPTDENVISINKGGAASLLVGEHNKTGVLHPVIGVGA